MNKKTNFSSRTTPVITMNNFFICKNGQNISWPSVCDGYNQCIDGSDEQNCYCQGDVYACLQGNNVSCRIACATYGRVTCLTYHNKRACEQYIRDYSSTTYLDISSTSESSRLTNNFDALRYSIYLAIGIFIFISIFIYLIRKNPSQLIFSCVNKIFNTNFNRKSPHRLSNLQQQRQFSSVNLSRSHYTPAPDINELLQSHHHPISLNDCYEPPPYPGLSLFSSIQNSDSNDYETIKPSSVSNSTSLPEPHLLTHCV